MNCPSCGFANAPAARFCGGCGNRLEATADAAERRHICLMFCDLVGSTPLSHILDAEDLRDVLGSYRHACEAVVLRHGGFVAQYYGDGIEVYFGYPHAREGRTRMRIPIIQAVAALVLSSCNANREVNLSSQTASEVFAGHYVVDNPYDPVSYAQNHTGWGGR